MTRLRILVADDNAAMLDSVVRLLSPEHDVTTVGDGQALLEAAAATDPEVLVLDISMPILSGIEAATILRKTGSQAKIIFLTVHNDPDFVVAARDAGALGYVVKQRMTSDLPLAISRALKGQLFTSPSLRLNDT